MILRVFIDFFFWVKQVVGWSKNPCNLILVIGFKFGTNLTVISSLNCWDQSIIVRSTWDFKYDHWITNLIMGEQSKFG